jgi:hypothetical protein
MNEYLFPVPGKSLRKLLDAYAECSTEPWQEHLCIQDIMLAVDREDVKPLSYYAKRWGRNKSWVYRRMDGFRNSAEMQRRFENTERNAVKRKRNAVKRKPSKKAQSGQEVKRERNDVKRERNGIEQIQITDTELNSNTTANIIDLKARARDDKKPSVTRFKKPELPAVREFMQTYSSENEILIDPAFEAEQFFDYYTGNGWKVGRNSMKDWKAAARGWMRRAAKKSTNGRNRSAAQKVHRTYDGKNDPEWRFLYD